MIPSDRLPAGERAEPPAARAQRLALLGSLAGGVAHEFNNHLAGIAGFLDIAAAELPESHAARGHLDQARRGAGNAQALVRRLLSLARASGPSEPVAVDVGLLFAHFRPMVLSCMPAGVDVRLMPPEPGAEVLGVEPRLLLLLLQLAVGCGRCVTGEGACLEVRAEIEGSPARWVALVVVPRGQVAAGGVEAVRAALFGAVTGAAELSLAACIVQEHAGSIGLVEDGRGLCVRLPVAEVAQDRSAKGADGVPGGGVSALRVLLVDDDPTVRGFCRIALLRLGHGVIDFSNAEAALDAFGADEDGWDLLVADLSMPGMDGVDLIARARALRPGLAVVATSGNFAPFLDRLRPELGSRTVLLRKPFRVNELADAIASLTESRRGLGV